MIVIWAIDRGQEDGAIEVTYDQCGNMVIQHTNARWFGAGHLWDQQPI